ncbi:RNA methyltransferase [Gracilinema caldarium]|uniref:TrmH family RNA methyltransferase n=1 Tax=Gracilinema caldarium TaxID=215591 RepID=UPI0026ED1109|nr:RNA methyltransferase [Gracilinema caldarium]
MADVDLGWFTGLKDRDLRREGIIIAEGRLVAERTAAVCEPLGILCLPAALSDAEAISQSSIPIRVMNEAEIGKLTGFPFHRGLLLAARRPEIPGICDETVLDSPLISSGRRLVVLPHITDSENLGAIIRTAAALGWDGVLLGSGSADPFSRRVLRCSMAAVFALPLYAFATVHELELLKTKGWELWAAMLHPEAREPEALGSVAKLGVILGNERFGIEPALQRLCSHLVAIPQARSDVDGVDSLNVAAAAAILLWEGRQL